MDRTACVDLRTDELRCDTVITAVLNKLYDYSPRVEPLKGRLAFCLDADGVIPLFPSLNEWAKNINTVLSNMGFVEMSIVVGFSKFSVAAVARHTLGITVFDCYKSEREALDKVSLNCFFIPSKVLRCLGLLNINTVGELVKLPASEISKRFGLEVKLVYEQAALHAKIPLQPLKPELPIVAKIDFEEPETDTSTLSFAARRLLVNIAQQSRSRYMAITGISITLFLDHMTSYCDKYKTASPTVDAVQLSDLFRLKLEGIKLAAGITGIELRAELVPINASQMELFQKKPRRNPESAKSVLAQIEAEFGEHSIVKVKLKDRHLPEACFEYVAGIDVSIKKDKDKAVSISNGASLNLIRRIYNKPISLQSRPVAGPRGCHFFGMGNAPVSRLVGPYTISGGWWHKAIHRDYYFAIAESGQIFWIYFDRQRSLWFLHGEIQ